MSAPYVNFKFVNSKKLGQVKVKPSFEDFEYKKYPYLFKCKSCLIKKKNKKILKDGVYKIDGVVEVPKDMVLELQAGVKLLFSYRGGIDVKGKLVAKGKKNKKIIFDADPDSSNYNLWQIFQISKGGQASFEHAEIKNINGSENANSSAINVDNAGLRFQNSVIKNVQGKSAIFSKDSKIIVKNSKIENTEEAFLYSIGSDVFIKNTKFKHCARKTADVLIKQRKSNIKLEKIENISYARKIME
jgi:hypothetical protein